MSVLLIGSTGMGKSTLGNYLLNPDEEHMFDKQTFAVATDNKPMTQEVKVASGDVTFDDGESKKLTIIDTPGLNEDPKKDLAHLIEIIKILKAQTEISACIFVVKFSAKIDAQYRATMEYYSKLLPGLFEGNIIIVMTDFATDERSEQQRKRQCIDVEKVKHNTIEELCQYSNKAQLFIIDCQPLESAEKKTSQKVRTEIIDHIFKLPLKRLENYTIEKTDYVKQEEVKEHEKLQREKAGYKTKLEELEADTNSKKSLNDIREIEALEQALKDKDNDDAVEAECWHIRVWKMCGCITHRFNFQSQYEITKRVPWTDQRCEFIEIKVTGHEVTGRVQGKCMSRINASVTVYTTKRIIYAKEINNTKASLEEKKQLQSYTEAQQILKKMELLQNKIDETERKITDKKFESNYMTIEEAESKLEELENDK